MVVGGGGGNDDSSTHVLLVCFSFIRHTTPFPLLPISISYVLYYKQNRTQSDSQRFKNILSNKIR